MFYFGSWFTLTWNFFSFFFGDQQRQQRNIPTTTDGNNIYKTKITSFCISNSNNNFFSPSVCALSIHTKCDILGWAGRFILWLVLVLVHNRIQFFLLNFYFHIIWVNRKALPMSIHSSIHSFVHQTFHFILAVVYFWILIAIRVLCVDNTFDLTIRLKFKFNSYMCCMTYNK